MILTVKRTERFNFHTFGQWYDQNNEFICHNIEDTDRLLNSEMSLYDIERIKIHGKTAIPSGTYEVGISYSNKFKKLLPILFDVPGFTGIRIHPGNYAVDTEGCLLPGLSKRLDMVTHSRDAFKKINKLIVDALKVEKVFVQILP